MLRDREYMRDPEGSGYSLTITLVVALLVIFVVQSILMFYAHAPLLDWFALSLGGFREHRYWQILTFQFLHLTPWPWHVLGNCIGLYFFGRSIEETFGKKTFLLLYFGSGFLGGAFQLFVTWILPNYPDYPVVGASAGVMGLFGAYAMLYPMRDLTTFIYFFPVTLRVIWIFWFVLLYSAFTTIIPYTPMANAAHLAGILTGVAFIRWGHRFKPNLGEWNPLQRKMRRERMIKAATINPKVLQRRPRPDVPSDLPSDEFISKEVDPILDKISAHGIQSLTERERAILQAARAKMSKR
ncbi:MAG TPA: rhomboid family intramembrane serine protease [Verrucomicrobiae bacterium]|nr:rhomboid family intramembrane serine protease [Verrucomicrobiae bacterium]